MDSHVDWHAIDRAIGVVADVRLLATNGDVAGSTVARRLLEVGFVPGEQVREQARRRHRPT